MDTTPATPFADALRYAITHSGLTAYAVAKKAGVATQVVTRWLAGERGITLESADKLARALEIPPLFSGKTTISRKLAKSG